MQMLDMMSEEKDSIGWISMADVLLITTILLVGGAYGVAHYADSQDRIIDELRRKRLIIIDSGKETIADLIRQINILKNENLLLRRDKDTLDTRIKDLGDELASKKTTLEILQSQLAETKQVLQTKESMVRHLVSRIESLYQKLGTAQKELIVLVVKIDAIKEQLDNSEQELALLKKKVASLKEADELIIKLKQKLDTVQKELMTARKQNLMLKSKLQEKQNELDKMSSENALLNDEILNLQLSNKSLIAQCVAILEAEEVSNAIWQEKFDELNKLLNETNKAYSKSQDAVESYESQIAAYEKWFQQQNDRIMKPVETARVVIRVRAEDLPKSVDLDIYVQDPEDALCFWKQPRVLTEYAERATLIPSEALRFESVKKNRPSANIEEETYYASIPLTGKPYLVFCMFREKSETTEYQPIRQKITWEISIKNADRQAKILKGERLLECKTGGVEVKKSGDTTSELYPGLEPLTGFTVSDAEKPDVTLLDEGELPEFLRGWIEETGEGKRYLKQSDSNPMSQ